MDALRADANDPFTAIERRTVASDTIEQIRRLIATGTLVPGQRLPSERTLAEMLGVSRPSLREAIGALSAMGILDTRQGSGSYISSLSSDNLALPLSVVLDVNQHALHELAEVRLLLEVGAAEAAARRIDNDKLVQLDAVRLELHQTIDDIEAFVDGDIAFHKVIHEASGNTILLALMQSLSTLGKRSRMLTARRRAVREASVHEHDRIYQALKAYDVLAAGAAMRSHLLHVAPELDVET